MALGKGTRRALLAGAVILTFVAGTAIAPGFRASCGAAWVAFRDPSRLQPAPDDDLVAAPARPLAELEQPDLDRDFGRAADVELADAGALSSFVTPDLPIPISQRTLRFVDYFTRGDKGRQAFAERFRRAGRHRAQVEQALRDAELPEDLLWLVAIVSGFEPQAVSPKGAAGLFQLMPETAARFGLAESEWIDERRSIPRSTRAGVKLLRELFDRYQQWDLALAAYNLGADNLDEAVAKLKKRRGPREADKPVELKDLAEARLLPKETANFVPQVQAFAFVAANRGRFGLDDLDVAPPFEMAELAVPAETPLRLVARAASIPLSTLRDYNPDLLRDRTPPGEGAGMVDIPADKLPGALTALPVLLAQERAKQAAAAASASPDKPPAEPSASASAAQEKEKPPPPPPPERFTLASGVVIERRPTASAEITLGARVEVLEGARTPKPGGAAFELAQAPLAGELGAALDRLAAAVHKLATDGGDAAVEARRRGGAGRRRELEKAPYGGAWLTLGDRLFAKGSPLAGAVLAAPLAPFQSVVITEAGGESPAFRAPLRITVTADGPADARALAAQAERAFAGVLASRAAVTPLLKEERLELAEAVPGPRAVYAWLAPSADDSERAGLMLALLALAHDEHGRAARALVQESHVAVRVRGFLDVGEVASVVAIEATPSVLHDLGEVDRELRRAVEGFADKGPTEAELVTAKGNLRARLQAARARAGGEAKAATLARIGRLEERAAALGPGELGALVKRVFAASRRVVVTTRPKG